MVVAEQSETYVPEFDMRLDAPLHEILRLDEPWKSATLGAWLDAFDDENGGLVKIKTVEGTGVKLPFKTRDGKEFNVPPSGRRIPRRLALKLLEQFGPDGQYTGMDLRTGLREDTWEAMNEDERASWGKAAQNFNFNTNYLIHVTDVDDDEEEI